MTYSMGHHSHMRIQVHQAKARFSELLARAAKGERIEIVKRSTPIATLGPPESPGERSRLIGLFKGQVEISADFDDPIPGFEEYT